jgi:hypothetical protein
MNDSSSGGGEMNEIYRIRVHGHLADRWSDCLEGLEIKRQTDGTTELVGPLVDQAALHGVIGRIRDLGLPLLAVDRETGTQQADRLDCKSGYEPKGAIR